MKVIFFGLGSIGKKHLSNLKLICDKRNMPLEVYAYRKNSSNSQEIEGVTFIHEMDAVENDYDVAFITNPTALHLSTLTVIFEKAKYIFLEKPAFEVSKDISKFTKIENNIYVAAPLRYKLVMKNLKSLIANERVISARVICSTYLPSWRNDDYRQSYSANSKLGGGIELDCIHELDYVVDLFGFPQKKVALMGRKSALEIESNDTALYILEYEDKFIEVHLDYYGKVPQRKIELITDNNVFEIDILHNRIFDRKNQIETVIEEEVNDMYIQELNYFIDNVLKNHGNHNNLKHANQVLKLAKE